MQNNLSGTCVRGKPKTHFNNRPIVSQNGLTQTRYTTYLKPWDSLPNLHCIDIWISIQNSHTLKYYQHYIRCFHGSSKCSLTV